jgi:hypothetical protein
MKNIFFLLMTFALVITFACSKKDIVPPYTPPVSANFSVNSLNHTKDTVNVGDTLYLTAAGIIYDTTQNISTYVTVNSNGLSYGYGTASAPIRVNRVIGAQNGAVYNWTATIMVPGATNVSHGTKLTISANFIYALSLSSEQGNLSATDAGIVNKTVFVQ